MPTMTDFYSFVFPLHQGLVKTIPGAPEGKPQIHEVTNPVLGRMQK